MRWVDRGPEPGGVAEYARQFTPGWIIIARIPEANGLLIPIGASSGQRWAAGPTTSAGTASGNAEQGLEPGGESLRLTISGRAAAFPSWFMSGPTGFSVAVCATLRIKATNGRIQGTSTLAPPTFRNARNGISIMMRILGKLCLGSVVKSTWSKSPSPESGIWPSKKGSS